MNAVMQRSCQRGVVLIFTLIVLLILTIGGLALVRSMHSSLFSAGNLAFRRDLVNQGEQAVANVMAEFGSGGILSTSTVTDGDLLSANYTSTTLQTNPQGVPTALLVSDLDFAAYGTTANDIAGPANSNVTIRYVIDRLCNATGVASSTTCVQSTGLPPGGTHNRNTAVPAPSATVYRLSARVTGPRNTQVFLQTTITKPD